MDMHDVVVLTSEQNNHLETLQKTYSDFCEFPQIIEQLKQALVGTNDIELNRTETKKIAEKYFTKKDYNTKKLVSIFKIIQQIFKSAYILVLYTRQLAKQKANPKPNPVDEVIWVSLDTFLAEYPEFDLIEVNELNLLHNFRNMVKVTTMLIDPRLSKQAYLNICGRLEGSQCSYITGGGQRNEVTNRVNIYEREGGVPAEPRPERALNKTKKKGVVSAKRGHKKRKASIVSNSSASGNESDSESESETKQTDKSTMRARPTMLPPSRHRLTANTATNTGTGPVASVSTVVTTIAHTLSSDSLVARPSTPSRGDSSTLPNASTEDPSGSVIPLDWTSASAVVAGWNLPQEESFMSALLKGDVIDM